MVWVSISTLRWRRVTRALSREGKGPPGSGKPDDQTDKDRDKHQKGDKPRKSNDKFDRFGKFDKDNELGHEDYGRGP
jgi:hypothetical protein